METLTAQPLKPLDYAIKSLDNMDHTRTTKSFKYIQSLSYHRELQRARQHHQDRLQRIRSTRSHKQALQTPKANHTCFRLFSREKQDNFIKLQCTIV